MLTDLPFLLSSIFALLLSAGGMLLLRLKRAVTDRANGRMLD